MANWSGLWNHVYSGGRQEIGNRQPHVQLGRMLKPYGRGKFRQLLRTLVNGAVGDAATRAQVRVGTQSGDKSLMDLGGVRTIQTELLINRNTTADDRDEFVEAIDYDRMAINNFPVDKSGNGGGGKLGY